ncbi:MAG TPA: nucleotidyltransferase family protein [Pseudomonadales bacterium]|nr:nucleotidyltransferase family protein [Pseudomonadales bacterium]
MKAMILAAGLGKRMQPLTLHTPKPLLSVGGKPLIVHHLERLRAAGCVEIVINLAHLGEKIASALGSGERYGVRISYSRESEALETAGGIIQALPLLGDEPFWVVNGDVWCDRPFTPLCLIPNCVANLLLVPNPEHHPQGDFVLDNQQAVSGCPESFLLRDKNPADNIDASASTFTFSGISVLHPDLFRGYPPGRRALGPVLRDAMRQQQVMGSLYLGGWLDVGTPERLAELDALLSAG